jgi:hypothetical protein
MMFVWHVSRHYLGTVAASCDGVDANTLGVTLSSLLTDETRYMVCGPHFGMV